MTDLDVQYLRDLAKFLGRQADFRRLNAIADRLESFAQPKREHVASEDCWCEPELDSVAEDGTKVWVHRELQ